MTGTATDVVLTGATLLDGTGAAPLPDAAIAVSGGRITWVGPAAELGRSGREPGTELARGERRQDADGVGGREIIDVSGTYVTPGLMDGNVHLVLNCDPEILLAYDPGHYDELVTEAAQVALRAGITTVFDTWGPLEAVRRVRDRINAGEVTGSRIFCAGNIIGNGGPWSPDFFAAYGEHLNPATVERVNRHWEQGVGAELTWMPADDLRGAVRDYIATSGIDFVKYASSAHAHYRFLALSPGAQRAIVEEAHAAGLLAQACALTPEALKTTIDAGVDLLQHGNSTGLHPIPQETLQTIVERGLPCGALIYTDRRLDALRADPGLAAPAREGSVIKKENARRLIAAGAMLVQVTDAGVFGPRARTSPWVGQMYRAPDMPISLGDAHILWIRSAIEAGMAPMAALVASTRDVARAYRKDDQFGTVEAGKHADLLVLDADPLADPGNYARIAHVMRGGELIDRDRLPERPVLTRDA
jgi:imidazolonepropionase-like amidohydrolase